MSELFELATKANINSKEFKVLKKEALAEHRLLMKEGKELIKGKKSKELTELRKLGLL